MLLKVDDFEFHLRMVKDEYYKQRKQAEALIKVLKPFAFAWQNAQTNNLNWEDCYSAHNVLIAIMGKKDYLKEARDAR